MNNAMKFIANLFKEGVILFIYGIIMGVLAILGSMVKSRTLLVLIYIAIVLFYMFFIILFTKSSGEKQYKNLLTGNIRRSKGVTEDVLKYCKPHEEYRAYKGLLIGVAVFLPMYLLLIIHAATDKLAVEAILKVLYSICYMPLLSFKEGISAYFMLPLSLLYIAAAGFGYIFGGKKIMLQQEKLQKTHDLIYGKDKP